MATRADELLQQDMTLNSVARIIPPAYSFIDTTSDIAALVDSLVGLSSSKLTDKTASPPSLYFDAEGADLSRYGTVSLIQLFVLPQDGIFFIDVHVLGAKAFSTPGANGQTLKGILESAAIAKAFFDVRNDSDALYSHFGIRLAGIHDIQIMEYQARKQKGPYLSGLGRCISTDIEATPKQRKAWGEIKRKGRMLFAPELGGSFDVFNERPLSHDMVLYCAQDVHLLPKLWILYNSKLKKRCWARKIVEQEADMRVSESQREEFNPHDKGKSLGHWNWLTRCHCYQLVKGGDEVFDERIPCNLFNIR